MYINLDSCIYTIMNSINLREILTSGEYLNSPYLCCLMSQIQPSNIEIEKINEIKPKSFTERITIFVKKIFFFLQSFFFASFREQHKEKVIKVMQAYKKHMTKLKVYKKWKDLFQKLLPEIQLKRIRAAQNKWLAYNQELKELNKEPSIILKAAYYLFPEEKEFDVSFAKTLRKKIWHEINKIARLQKRHQPLAIKETATTPIHSIRTLVSPGIGEAFEILLHRLETLSPKSVISLELTDKTHLKVQLKRQIKIEVITTKKMVQGGKIIQILGDLAGTIEMTLNPATKAIDFQKGFSTDCIVTIPFIYTGPIKTDVTSIQQSSPTTVTFHTKTAVAMPLVGNTQHIRVEESFMEELKRDWATAKLL
jgi:hypothetical protein